MCASKLPLHLCHIKSTDGFLAGQLCMSYCGRCGLRHHSAERGLGVVCFFARREGLSWCAGRKPIGRHVGGLGTPPLPFVKRSILRAAPRGGGIAFESRCSVFRTGSTGRVLGVPALDQASPETTVRFGAHPVNQHRIPTAVRILKCSHSHMTTQQQ